jgi:uncharacterized coiled-coil protein SlyX
MSDGFSRFNVSDYLNDPEIAFEYIKALEEEIAAQAKRIEELEDAFREIYEVYAGSEGFIPETCAEAHQQQLIKEMAEIAAEYMRKGLPYRE